MICSDPSKYILTSMIIKNFEIQMLAGNNMKFFVNVGLEWGKKKKKSNTVKPVVPEFYFFGRFVNILGGI